MIKRIMVPLDGTRFAEAALPYAMALAGRDGADLQLVTVWEPVGELVASADWVQQLATWEESRRAESRRYMAEVSRQVGEVLGKPVSIKYLLGHAQDELARAASQLEMDLVVMATHGHGPVNRVWLGSVADRYVRHGSVPVLLIRPAEEMPEVELSPAKAFQKILVPLDGSTLGEQVLRRSLLLGSNPMATEITLLTVVRFPLPMATPEGGVVLDSEGFLRAQTEAAQVHLARMADHIAPWGCKVSTQVIASPVTWKAIVDFATSGRYDLIAMATHGRGGAARFLLGSVTDKVMRSSPVPTLLAHPHVAQDKKANGHLIEQQLAATVLVDLP
jgi:nucleotide-binding universal stress UspA family protein